MSTLGHFAIAIAVAVRLGATGAQALAAPRQTCAMVSSNLEVRDSFGKYVVSSPNHIFDEFTFESVDAAQNAIFVLQDDQAARFCFVKDQHHQISFAYFTQASGRTANTFDKSAEECRGFIETGVRVVSEAIGGFQVRSGRVVIADRLASQTDAQGVASIVQNLALNAVCHVIGSDLFYLKSLSNP